MIKLLLPFFVLLQKHVYPYKIHRRVLFLLSRVRSLWMIPAFKECHHTVRFERMGFLLGEKYISIGEGTCILHDTYLTAWDSYGNQKYNPQIIIGKDCAIGAFNHISCINKITIGDGVLTGKWVTIIDNSHGDTSLGSLNYPPIERELLSKGPVVIGSNVWIGDKATILPGVQIGDGAVIAAIVLLQRMSQIIVLYMVILTLLLIKI
ncbi:acyltransferase [uncultured Bacteroides sp.]|uniref:acyltransferase n=1 Tax=uncultured Bacteroides sp. TaxID=162156 RepID=UPI002AA76923|nr:acyltransferase [uncultured Bacteroides sp.]